MRTALVVKSIAVLSVFLFVSATLASAIRETAQGQESVEVTAEACGIQGYENQTVCLTRTQYESLQQDLARLHYALGQTVTVQDAIPAYTKALETLAGYGLLPRSMSLEQALRLVVGDVPCKTLKSLDTGDRNYLALLAGRASPVNVQPTWPFLIICSILSLGQGYLVLIALVIAYYYLVEYGNQLPFSINSFICTPSDSNATGWLDTIGLLGLKKWEGTLHGSLFFPFTHKALIVGFRGIKLRMADADYFFLGRALAVGADVTR